MPFIPRRSQAEIMKYTGGTMGISAVPGSGKTHTLSALAADLVEKLVLDQDFYAKEKGTKEILIVTFSNAAVSNFATRISGFLSERNLMPGIGYRICTLHSMAAEIVRGHAESVGLQPDFSVLDENAAGSLLQHSVDIWLEKDQRNLFDRVIKRNLNESQKEMYYTKNWHTEISKMVRNVISQAKDYRMTPDTIRAAIESQSTKFDPVPLRMVCDIYESYQMQLKTYPALDFGDLMFYACQILEKDPGYLRFEQERWPYILEDEAQDSSLIQENVLRLLTGASHNWVRVGDPNQAINETFTTADPKFLLNFLQEADRTIDLKEAGRSTRSILTQANRLIRWVTEKYPDTECKTALVQPYIRLTDPGDRQGNPADQPKRIIYDQTLYQPQEEIQAISKIAVEHAKSHPEETIAILCPSNNFGTEFVTELSKQDVEIIEVLRSTKRMRTAADTLSKTIACLSRPLNAKLRLSLFEALYNHHADSDFYLCPDDCRKAREAFNTLKFAEDFFYPDSAEKFEKFIHDADMSEMLQQTLYNFRFLLRRWLDARFLSIDQLLLLISQDIFTDSEDLCTGSQMGKVLSQIVHNNPGFGLGEMAEEIRKIATNSAEYPGLKSVETQFDPNLYRGKIVVTTYHKAKGLEWDQVFLTSCNTYDFPVCNEKAKAERKARPAFIRDQLDLQAEMLEMLRVISFPEEKRSYQEGIGSRNAFIDNVRERLRLLYVGITRAKKGLYISCNSGRFNNVHETLAVTELRKMKEKE